MILSGGTKTAKAGTAVFSALLLLALLISCRPAIGASPVAGSSILNTATLSYTDANGNPVPGSSSQAAVTVGGAPVLSITVSGAPDPVAMGETLTYTVAYSNTGNATANNTLVTLNLSDYVVYQTSSGGGTYSAGPRTVTWNLGSLAAYSGGTLTVSVQLKTQADYPIGDPAAIANGTVITSAANMTSDETFTTSTESVTVGRAPNMELTVSASAASVSPGGTITYTLHYRNTGNLDATLVSISNALPSQTTYVSGSATGGGVLNNRTLTWDIGTVASGGEGDVSFQVTVSSIAVSGSAISDFASLLSRELSPVTSNQAVTYVRTADLRITKTVTPVRAGGNAEYTIRVYNEGYIPVDNIVVTDPLPAGTVFVSADGNGALNGSDVIWSAGTLGIGEEKVFKLVLRLTSALQAGTTVTNTVYATADNMTRQSTSAAFQVAARTTSKTEFYNSNWVRTHSFSTGDNICMQVTDADQNSDPNAVNTVHVILTHILSGDVEHILLNETGNDTGVFRGCINSDSSQATSDNNDVSVTIDSSITITYTDPMDGTDTSEDTALIDPFGVIFNSMTGERIAGAVVTLIDASTGQPADITKLPFDPNPANTTAADGFFAFRFVAPGSYYFSISLPPGYTFPSIVPDASLPAGFVIGTGSRGEVFSLNIGDEPLNLDIPADPPSVETLAVTKTADRETAYIGDIVKYTITVSNIGSLPVNDTLLTDILPHGVQYVAGTSTVNGTSVADPQGAPGKTLVWPLSGINTGATVRVAFHAIAGVDSNRGNGRNTAYAGGIAGAGKAVTSNTAYHTMRIKEGVFTSDGIVIGKVFHDANANSLQDKGEEGIKSAVLYMENGARVTADEYGRFAISGVKPGTHVLKIDKSKLPCGFVPMAGANRFMGSADSQFVDIVPGGLFSADFPVAKEDGRVCADDKPANAEGTDKPAGYADVPLEEKISGMDPKAAILSPADGATVSAANTDVLVKGPLGAEFRLFVNGKIVSSKNIGRRIEESEKKIVILEYIGVYLNSGEENTIELEIVNDGGASGETATARITAAGNPYEIISDPANIEITADGESTAILSLKVVDIKGATVAAAGIMTVSTSAGEILNKDIDLTADGIQVLYIEGAARIEMKSSRVSGTGELTAIYEKIEKRIPVFLSPSSGDEMTLGIGEFVFGRGKRSGDEHFIKSFMRFDRAYYSNAKGAFFIKKRLKDNLVLTSSYDSAKSKDYELNNERYSDYTDDNTYPLFGDDSKISYEAKTQNKLFLKLERNKSQALIGDYSTNFFDSKLATYDRTLNGLKLNFETKQYRLGSFAARTSQVKALDTLPAKGISGYYYLSNSPLVDGSESVVVETRDRQRPWMVLDSKSMTRWSDYTIDYDTGALMFRNPVPAYTASLDPVFILVRYETNNGGDSYYLYGARGRLSLSRWYDVGFTAVTEENAAGDYHQYGIDTKFILSNIGAFKAELASTESLISNAGGYGLAKGQAYSMSFERKKKGRYELTAYTNKAGNDFGNIHATDIQRGTGKYGFDLIVNAADNTVFKGKYFMDRDFLNSAYHRFESIGFTKSKRTFEWYMELFREKSRDRFVNSPVYSSRYPFDNTEETPEETTSLRLGLSRSPSPRTKLSIEHQQDIQYSNFNISTIGLDFRYSSTTHTYVRQEFWRYIDNSGNRTVFGVESALSKSTSVFNEYRMEDNTNGNRIQRVIGLKNKIRASRDVTLDFSLENLETVRGAERNATPDAFTFTSGVEYNPGERFKMSARYEYRDSTADDSHMFETGFSTKLNKNFSWLVKQKYFDNSSSNGSTGTGFSTMTGFAYRPSLSNRLNFFTRYELRRLRSTPVQTGFSPEDRVFSFEGAYRPSSKTTYTAKYAGKTSINGNITSYTDMWAARALYDITKRLDFSAEFRLLTSHKIGTRSTGGSLELGYRCVKNLWLSLGYALDDFDADLTGDSYFGRGYYMRLRFKLD